MTHPIQITDNMVKHWQRIQAGLFGAPSALEQAKAELIQAAEQVAVIERELEGET